MRIKSFLQGLSISKKFIFIYISIFAIPIIVYALVTFRAAEKEQMDAFYMENREKLTEIHHQILQKVSVCDRTAQLALSNYGFIQFVTSNMKDSGYKLVHFKHGEYQEMQNMVNINQSIYTITFFINNPKIYEMLPILLHMDRFPYPDKIPKIFILDGQRMYDYDNGEKRSPILTKEDTRRMNLYRKIDSVKGFIEVSMLLEDFLEGTLLHQTRNTSYFMIKEEELIIVDEKSPFFGDRMALMPSIQEVCITQTTGDSGRIEWVNQESFYILYQYIEPLDAYIYQISSIDAMMNILGKTRQQLMVGVIIAIALLSLITSIVTLLLTNKIRLLRASIRRVESGDLNVVIPVTGSDEVDEVAKHFNHMVVKIRDLINKLIAKEVAVKDIQIKALQSQINSHFIHNALEAIRILAVLDNKNEIATATESLGNLMHYSMNWDKQLATLKEEITLVQSYMLLMNLISDVQVSFAYQIEEKMLGHDIPKMLIQPIVENAIKHGIQPTSRDGAITISIETHPTKNYLYIVIEDNGIGMDKKELDSIRQYLLKENNHQDKHAIGLRNADERIKHFYGHDYGIQIESKKGTWTKVILTLPYNENVGGW